MTELSLRTLKKGERIIYILNSLVMLMINVQAVCLFFARSLLTFTILTNLDSFRNPSGNALQYIIGIIIVLILSFLPVTSLRRVFRLRFQRILSIILAFEIILVMAAGNNPSPLWGYISVAKSAKAVMGLTRNPKESKDSSKMFFKPVALSLAWVEKPDSLRDHPNIILIFTEGLSQSIVDDKRDINSYYGLMSSDINKENLKNVFFFEKN